MRPLYLRLSVTDRCNLRCVYCRPGAGDGAGRPTVPLDDDELLALVDRVGRVASIGKLRLTGGEPLCRPGLPRLVERLRALLPGAQLCLTTNGTLLTGARMEYLMEHGFHIGVSLDGARRAHDLFRRYPSGRSSHARVSKNLAAAVKRYPPLEVIAVVDPASGDWIDESFEYIFDLGVRDLTFNMNYEGDWTDEACDTFEAAVERLGDAYLARYRQGHDFTCNPIDAKIITRLKEGYSCADQCDFGCEEIAISPTGQMYPCERLVGMDDDPKVQIGDIWDGVDPKRRDALRNAKNVTPTQCIECVLNARCMYWCGCVNYATTGRVDGVTGTLCWNEQLFIKTADRVASALYKEQNPVFLEKYYLSAGSALARREAQST